MSKYNIAANILLAAHKSNTTIANFNQTIAPKTIYDAYEIMKIVSTGLGNIGGWKTAPSNADVHFNYAPIPAQTIYQNNTALSLEQYARGDLELEVGFIFNKDLPPAATLYTDNDIIDAIGSICVCIEVIMSRFDDRTAMDSLSLLADSQNAACIIIGDRMDWSDIDLSTSSLTLKVNDAQYIANGGAPMEAIIKAITRLANISHEFGGIHSGQVVISGARVGPIKLTGTSTVTGSIENIGTINTKFL